MPRLQVARAADNTTRDRPGALVLGSACITGRIAAVLEREGYVCETLEALPSIADPNAHQSWRRILEGFIARHGTLPPGRSHCLHPGVTLWAERPELVQIAQELRISVLSPPSRVVSLFANKLSLLLEAEKLGIPHLAISTDPIHSARELEQLIERSAASGSSPFPLILKSARGGGILVLQQPEDIEDRLPLWMEQLRRNVGEVLFFVERYLDGARLVSQPFARLQDGRFVAFPSVDGSLQSRYRKLVEVCPATSIEDSASASIVERVRHFAQHVGYIGVGALEFLYDGSRAYLVEGLCRLSTGYGAWEQVAGTTAIEWQLAALENRTRLPTLAPKREWSTTLVIRVSCEDPILQLPLPGVVREVSEQREWKVPGAAAEADVGVRAGDDVAASGQGLVALVRVGAYELRQALSLARGVLSEIWIAGGLLTNERFIDELLQHPWVRENVYHAGFVDEEFVPTLRPDPEWMSIAARMCQESLGGAPAGTRWIVADQWADQWADASAKVPWARDGWVRVSDGRELRASASLLSQDSDATRWMVRIGLWQMQVRCVLKRSAGGGPQPLKLRSLVPGRVHSLLFLRDSAIPAHTALCVIECQGMLVPHALPVHAILGDWKVNPEDVVSLGQALATFSTN